MKSSSDDLMKHTEKTHKFEKNLFFNISLEYFKKCESFKFEIFHSENVRVKCITNIIYIFLVFITHFKFIMLR